MAKPTQPIIEGVRIQPLKLLPNERGRLMEIQRSDDALFPGFGQAYLTATYPGVVKAWYKHHEQLDQIVPITGLVKLVLFDGRPDSPTHAGLNEIVLGDLAPKLVQIPPGVWHGFKTISLHEAFLLHLNSIPYGDESHDEDRLPPDDPTIPYKW